MGEQAGAAIHGSGTKKGRFAMAKISGVEIRPGNNIEYEGGLWRAVKI